MLGVFIVMGNKLATGPEPATFVTALTRIIAGLIMQLMLAKDIKNSMNMMKYCLNHSWKFENPFWAFITVTLQTIMNMFVVILNYWAIQLADNPLDIVMNFLALKVVSEIDDYFYSTHRDFVCKDIIENLEKKWSYLFKI